MLKCICIGVIFAAHTIADPGEACEGNTCEHALRVELLQTQVVSTKSAIDLGGEEEEEDEEEEGGESDDIDGGNSNQTQALAKYELYPNTNCKKGHGCDEIVNSMGYPTRAACEAWCNGTPNCGCAVQKHRSKRCYLKQNCNKANFFHSNRFDLYVNLCGGLIPGMDNVPQTNPKFVVNGLKRVAKSTDRESIVKTLAAPHKPGYQLFGDHGCETPGFGGIKTFDVYQVTKPKGKNFFGLRQVGNQEDVWFVDEPTWKAAGTFADYSNNVALTCWAFTHAIRCHVPQGAGMVVGSGAWRDTSVGASDCDKGYHDGENGITSPQIAKASILQYIFDPTLPQNNAGGECCVVPLDFAAVSNSFSNPPTMTCW